MLRLVSSFLIVKVNYRLTDYNRIFISICLKKHKKFFLEGITRPKAVWTLLELAACSAWERRVVSEIEWAWRSSPTGREDKNTITYSFYCQSSFVGSLLIQTLKKVYMTLTIFMHGISVRVNLNWGVPVGSNKITEILHK